MTPEAPAKLGRKAVVSAGKSLMGMTPPDEISGGKQPEAQPPAAAPPAAEERAEQDVSPAAPPAAEPSPVEESTVPEEAKKAAWERLGKQKEELLQRTKSLEEERRQLREQVDELQRQQKVNAALASDRPEGFEDWTMDHQSAYMADRVVARDISDLQSKVDQLQTALDESNLQRQLEGFSKEQQEAIRLVHAEHRDLPFDDTVAVAQRRFHEFFGASQTPTPELPATHQVQRPAVPGERQPTKDPNEEHLQNVREPGPTAEKVQALAGLFKHRLRAAGHRL